MIGSVALDVAIGLIFIFLLYSLLASVIGEIVAVLFGLRGRNLAQAICRMLEDQQANGGNKLIYFLRGIKNSVMVLLYGRNGKAFKAFYNHPYVKYMAENKLFSKPSYLSADIFSKVILDLLKVHGKGGESGDLERIKNSLKGEYSEKEKIDAINRILQQQDQTTAQESIKLIMNRDERLHLFESESRWFITTLLEDAQNDLVKFKYLLEKWFDQTMERATGWYKRMMQLILLFIGLCLAIIFNASTIEIVNILSKDKDAREKLVQLATAYVENNPRPTTPTTGRSSDYPTDSTINARLENQAIKVKLDSLLAIKDQLDEDIEEANSILGLGWSLPDSLDVIEIDSAIVNYESHNLLFIKRVDTSFLYAKIPKRLDPTIAAESFLTKESTKEIEQQESLIIGINNTNSKIYLNASSYNWRYFWDNIWGYLITALAISLGAPFWFDLLNKLVKVRSSVQAGKETEAQKNSDSGNVPPPQREG